MRNILFAVVFFSQFLANAQTPITPNPLVDFEVHVSPDGYELWESVTAAVHLSNGNLLFGVGFLEGSSQYPSQLNFYNDVLKRNGFYIIIRDQSLSVQEVISSFDIFDGSANFYRCPFYIKEQETPTGSTFEMLGGVVIDTSSHGPEYRYYHLITDRLFRPLSLRHLDVPSPTNIFGAGYTILNRKGNIIRTFAVNRVDSTGQNVTRLHVDEFDLYGNLVQLSEIPYNFNRIHSWGISEFRDGGYIFGSNIILDSLLQLVANVPNYSLPSSTMIPLDSTMLIFGTGLNIDQMGNAYETDLIMRVGAMGGKFDTLFRSNFPQPVRYLNPTSAFTLVGDETAYLAFSRDAFSNTTPSNIVLKRVNIRTGVEEWSVSFGGDYTYIPLEVFGTIDGGCVLTARRQIQSGGGLKVDVVAARFDQNGMPIKLTQSENFNLLTNVTKVYPNPVTNELTIEIAPQIDASRMELYDATGKLLLTEDLLSPKHRVFLGELPKGLYFYRILDKNGVVADAGKVVKN